MKLLDHPISQTCWRVRIAAHIKGLTLDLVPVDLPSGETTHQSYSALNPQKLVPALVAGAEVIGQSLAIIDYFEQIQPAPALLPADAKMRARVMSFVQLLASDTAPLAVIRIAKQLEAQFGADDAAIAAFRQHWYTEGLAAAEKLLAGSNSRHAFGDEITLADIVLVPCIATARRFGTDTSGFKRLEALYDAAIALPAFSETSPQAAMVTG